MALATDLSSSMFMGDVLPGWMNEDECVLLGQEFAHINYPFIVTL